MRSFVLGTQVVQSRTAIGRDTSGQMVFTVYRGLNHPDHLFISDENYDPDEKYTVKVGRIMVTHPLIMVGNAEEIKNDLLRAAYNTLGDHPDVTQSRYGDYYLTDAAAPFYNISPARPVHFS